MARAESIPEKLARDLSACRGEMSHSGKLLHDEAGPLLSAAGLRLSLLRLDNPSAADGIAEVLEMLDKAMEHIREASQRLNPSPAARSGLKPALERLAEKESAMSLTVTGPVKLPPAAAALIFEAVSAAVRVAVEARAQRIRVVVTAGKGVRIRISDDGRKGSRVRDLGLAMLVARAGGLAMDLSTKKDTIVSIRYGVRRTAGG